MQTPDQLISLPFLELLGKFVRHFMNSNLFKRITDGGSCEVIEDTLGQRGGETDPAFGPVIIINVADITGNIPSQRNAEKPRFREIKFEIVTLKTHYRKKPHTLAAAGKIVPRVQNIHIAVRDLKHSGKTVRIRP